MTGNDPNPPIAAVCCVANYAIDMLPHWLTHYARLGVGRIILVPRQPPDAYATKVIEQCAQKYKFELCTSGRLSDLPPNAWLLWSDVEELHEYPAPLADCIASAESHGAECINGKVLDRVADDGAMPRILPSTPIWEEFPHACRLTAQINPAGGQKTMLQKAAQIGNASPGQPLKGWMEQFKIHRFGWFGECAQPLLAALARPDFGHRLRLKILWNFTTLSHNAVRINVFQKPLESMRLSTPPPSHEQPAAPFIGDKVVLLDCDEPTRMALARIGFQPDCTICRDGVDYFLRHWTPGTDVTLWLDRRRNEAALSGQIATIWMPKMPADLEAALRAAAADDLLSIRAGDVDDALLQISAFALPPRRPKIFAVCTIRDGGADLLPHWLKHYSDLGADTLVLATVNPTDPGAEKTIQDCSKRWNLLRYALPPEANDELDQDEVHRTVLRRSGARPGDWVLHTDLDEFHEFPAPLDQIIAACDAKPMRAIFSRFTDHIARDGSLAAIQPTPSIWEQFPIECAMSEAVCRKYVQKVMLARFEVRTTAGHHDASNAQPCGVPLGRPEDYHVHHFRWHAEAAKRLAWINGVEGVDPYWKREAERVINWFESNQGRIDMSDPKLQARERDNPFFPRAKILAVARVDDDNAGLLPHWLEHYTNLGVEKIYVSAAPPKQPHTERAIAEAARKCSFQCCTEEEWKQKLEEAAARGDTWLVDAELDELHEFPAMLKLVIERASTAGITSISSGTAWDHLESDGKLPAVQASPNLFDQFPVLCKISDRLFGRKDVKTILSRLGTAAGTSGWPIGRAEQYVTHRFSWHGQILKKLQGCLDSMGVDDPHGQQLPLFLESARRNAGRLRMEGMNVHRPITSSSARRPALQPLPYIGDRLVLIHCDGSVRRELRAAGLASDCAVGSDGVDCFLSMLVEETPSMQSDAAIAKLRPWIMQMRNEAAITGQIPAIWMPNMPAALREAIRQIAGSELLEITCESVDDARRQIEAHARPKPQGGKTVFAVCALRNGSADLLPHWLAHYTKLGADRIVLAVVDPADANVEAEIQRCAKRWTFDRFATRREMLQDHLGEEVHRAVLRQAGAQPEDWVLHTDLDEFHEFPAPLREVMAAAEEAGIESIVGNFLDRVTSDGTLARIQPTPTIWEQFPIGCLLTKNITRGEHRKLMLARYRVHSSGGHHCVTNQPTPTPAIGTAEQYFVHHFKWHSEVIGRLQWGMAQPNVSVGWSTESQMILDFIGSGGVRINVNDPRLESRECGNPSNAWAAAPATLSSIGDKLVLLNCPPAVNDRLLEMGLIEEESGVWEKLTGGADHASRTAQMGPCLTKLRNRAAMSGRPCAVWMEQMPPAVENAVRHIAGADLVEISATDGNLAGVIEQFKAMALPKAPAATEIFLAGTLDARDVDLLPHWLEHYARQGVNKILLSYPKDEQVQKAIDACRGKITLEAYPWASAEELGTAQDEVHRTMLRRAGARPATWVVHANVGEFLLFPGPVDGMASAMNARLIDGTFGTVIDHVAADGMTPPLFAAPSIWEQFSIGCRLFSGIGAGIGQRLMMARFSVRAEHGHQSAVGVPTEPARIGSPEQYEIHDFRWHSDCASKVASLAAQAKVDPYWKIIAGRIQTALAANSGKVNLSDPSLQAHEVWHPSRMSSHGSTPVRLPYIGDKVLLLNSPAELAKKLRGLGLKTSTSTRMNLDSLRDDAAMSGGVAAILSPPAEMIETVKSQIGNDAIEFRAETLDDFLSQIHSLSRKTPATGAEVWAVCAISDEPPALIPHWLEHVSFLGVKRIVLATGPNPQSNDELDRILEDCRRRFPLQVFQSAGATDEGLCRTALRRAGAGPRTWVIQGRLADLYQFPETLDRIAAEADKQGVKAVFGSVLDRLTSDGSTPPVLPTPPLWEQFPVGCRLSKNVGRMDPVCLMMSRFEIRTELARHAAANAGLATAPFGSPHAYIVHRFAWHNQAIKQLENRLSRSNPGAEEKKQIQGLVVWIKQQNGKWNVKHPLLQAINPVPLRVAA